LWSEKSVTLVALTVPLLAVSIPLLEVLLSILRRYLRNRPIFEPDRGHIHHKLLDRGLSPRGAVLTIYGMCSVVAILSLLASALRNQFSSLIVIAFCGVVWVGIRHLDYTEFALAGRLFLRGGFRRIIDSETRLIEFQRTLARATGVHECWIKIRAASREFGFHGVRMNLNGQAFEDFESRGSKRLWELRIALPDAQNVNFFRELETEVSPMVLSGFVTAVERGMKCCLERGLQKDADVRETEVVLHKVMKRHYPASAVAAGAGGQTVLSRL
jgi:UDP-GlcNAc:undecaprenyl-phosphate GlcNAc-1-phosphate transferase